MTPRLFLDVTRICTRIVRSTPTGIDRVEYAYATEVLRRHPEFETVGVVTTPLFSGALRDTRLKDILDRVAGAWAIDSGPQEDAVYCALAAHLGKPRDMASPICVRFRGRSQKERLRSDMIFPIRDLLRSPVRLRRRVRNVGNRPSVYLNTSHTQLDKAHRFLWTSYDLTATVVFVHDAIPIEYPEYVSPGSAARHANRLETVARLATLIIVNSEFTAQSVRTYFEQRGHAPPRIEVVPLGVTPWFSERTHLLAPPSSDAPPYFVCVGTIEPRKNLIFLFNVWRELSLRLGSRTPRLVIVGARGWENENMVDILERSRSLAPYITEVSDLTDAGLASLLKGARGLVAPSLVEGFGLPVVECLALGVPVIASDIPAHREVSGGQACLLGPTDGRAWAEAVEGRLTDEFARPAEFRPLTWAEHVSRAMQLIRDSAAP